MANIPTPSPRALAWQNMEMGFFIHFGINTFYDQEWGDGSEDPARFNPTQLDARQWVRAAKAAGFQYAVLTAKHHDGFCLWPTSTTMHSVKSSPCKNGQGDVVREFTNACAEFGVKAGLYLSPWDRNAPCYADVAAYDEFYITQLTELMTQYGPLCEVWFDGAGSVGREYDWERIISTVRAYQPDAVVFNMGRPDIRWVGNEDGLAPYPCWNTASAARQSMYTQDMETWLPGTPEWVPAECDVPIRKLHWFWHPNDEDSLRTLPELVDIYERSVGRGCNLLLNLSPDDRGLLSDTDVTRLGEWAAYIDAHYKHPAFSSGAFSGTEYTLPCQGNIAQVILMEDIARGERIRAFTLCAQTAAGEQTLFTGSAVGHKQIIRFAPVEADAIVLRIQESVDTPYLLDMQLYLA